MQEQSPQAKHMTFKLDLRMVIALLVVVIIAMLILWRPWDTASSDRVIEVNGQASISAVPDQFVFSPSYPFKNSDKQAAIDAADRKSNELVAGLKNLGVAEKDIKTSTGSYDLPLRGGVSDETTYTLGLTVTVDGQELAQKVQDYLATTSPTGSVSPQPYFSDQKQKELEAEARDMAVEDARSKAEQAAQNLGFRVGKVKKVSDGFAFGIASSPELAVTSDSTQKLSLHPGENEVTYTMNITFYLK